VTDDLEISELGTGTLVPVPNIQLYVPQQDAEYFRNAKLTRIVKSDHTGKQKIRYIFTSSEVQDRC